MSTLQIMVEVQYYSAVALQIAVLIAMISRRLFTNARYFFIYMVWQTFSVATLYALQHFDADKKQFFYAYWIQNAICIALGLWVIVELFNRMFDQYHSVRKFAKLALLGSAAALVAIGVLVATYSHAAAYSVPILTALMVAERSLRILQVGLIVALFAVTKYLHLRWKNYLFGIAMGFGFYALMVLVGLTVRMYFGQSVVRIENTLQGTAYCAAVLIWTAYVYQRDAVRIAIIALPSHELEHWDRVLGQILSRH